MVNKDWYTINNIECLDTPALVIYPERVQKNIRLLTDMIDDIPRLRPHVKTHKNPGITRLMMEAGITKFKCATIAEAEMLGICKAPDVLMAYQPNGPKLDRFIKLIQAYPETNYSCLVDNQFIAKIISATALDKGIKIPVYIDLNVGMNRTGITPGEKALDLYQYCSQLSGIKLMGLHAYDGHIHDADINVRIEKSGLVLHQIEALQQSIRDKNLPGPIIIAGGSPTFPFYSKKKNIECSPGTFVYWDRGYSQAFTEQHFLPAVMVIARVVSLPDDTRICLDVGYKAVSAENELNKRIFFLNAPNLILTGQSEEHLVADAGKGHQYQIGDVFYGIPWHVCPTVALYERAYTVEDNTITGEWKNIARDRMISI